MLVLQPCPALFDPGLVGLYRVQPTRLLCPWNSPSKNTGVGCHFLLQGSFPTQGGKLGLLHCRQILYHLSHQGSPTIHLGAGGNFRSPNPWEGPQMLTQLKCTEMKECVLRGTSQMPLLCGVQVPGDLMTKYSQMFQARWCEIQGKHSSLECLRQAQEPLATAPLQTHKCKEQRTPPPLVLSAAATTKVLVISVP